MAELQQPSSSNEKASTSQPTPPPQPTTTFDLSTIGSPPKQSRFKKTHRRNESKLSRVSHLSIRSLKGETIDEEDEVDGLDEEKKPIYLFDFLVTFCPWMPRLSLPGSFRISPANIKKKFLQFLANHKTYDERVLSVGNKFSEHLFRELSIDMKKAQTEFGGPKQANQYRTSKYTILTFFPLNLFEQFRRVANIYFLLTLIITLFQPDPPVSPMSWLASLCFIIAVTMIKQAYEDYLRHKSDSETNRQIVQVLRNGNLIDILAEDINVGDIVYLTDNDMIPCDLVVLSTSLDHGQCYTMTANLDGETSLKTKQATPLTKNMRTMEEIEAYVGCIQCENPNPKLDSFLGRMHSFGEMNNQIETCSLSADNMLLNGAQIKNTSELYGVCVYAGKHTKIYQNSLITSNKFSSIERALNRYLIAYFFILLCMVSFCTIMTFTYGVEYVGSSPSLNQFLNDPKRGNKTDPDVEEFHWYIGLYFYWGLEETVNVVLQWNTLFNYIIPISLFASLEIQKFLGSMFVSKDRHFRDDNGDNPAIVRTSDINEELGLVTHLFCDKTGTLTQNIMDFQKYSQLGKILDINELADEPWNLLTMGMTLCHSVQYTSGQFVASSPDEQAIVEKCNYAGFSFCGEDLDGTVTVCAKDQIHTYKKLAELQFDSYRKCMSVIVRPKYSSDTDLEDTIYLFIKGAETSVLPVCIAGPVEETKKVVQTFAEDGLRTLVYAYKMITREQLNIFSEQLEAARQSIVNRIKYVRQVYKDMERGLTLIGATGIEDKLQENVVESINKFHRAGIITWMLTGDKKETAINMAHTSGMIKSPQDNIIDLCEVLDKKSLFKLIDEVHKNRLDWRHQSGPSLVISGLVISAVLKYPSQKLKLSEIATRCYSIVACRLSPVQKSQLITMIKQADNLNITCAIGDGGNDVAMIQEAHVGIGLMGREGSAASQSADFAISKFSHLQRLLLVHGHWYYTRVAFLVQYSFYKNVAYIGFIQLFYALYSNFSMESLYDSLFLVLANTFYTSVPVVIYGLTEQKYSAMTLLSQPELYKKNHGNALMSGGNFFKWFLLGLWHGSCSFFTWAFAWKTVEMIQPYGFSSTSLSAVVAAASISVVNLKILVEARYWSWILVVSIFWSIFNYILGTLIYNLMNFDNAIYDSQATYFTYIYMFTYPILIHISVITLTIVTALLPDFLFIIVTKIKDKLQREMKTLPK